MEFSPQIRIPQLLMSLDISSAGELLLILQSEFARLFVLTMMNILHVRTDYFQIFIVMTLEMETLLRLVWFFVWWHINLYRLFNVKDILLEEQVLLICSFLIYISDILAILIFNEDN